MLSSKFLRKDIKRQLLLCALLINISSQCADKEPARLPTPLDPQSKELTITYMAMQYIIHELAAKIAKEAEEEEEEYSLKPQKFQITRPGPQTEQGLYLCVDLFPKKLYTPWGPVHIYRFGSSGGSPLSNIFERFRPYLKLEFVENIAERRRYFYAKDQQEMRFFLDAIPNEIPQKELDKYRGSDRLILANHAGYASIYKIIAIGDIALPEPKLIKGTRRKDEEVTKNLEIMMEQCKQTGNLHEFKGDKAANK